MNKEIKKEKFVELRIKGETYDTIAKEIQVSKQTLINWSKDHDIKEITDIGMVTKYQVGSYPLL